MKQEIKYDKVRFYQNFIYGDLEDNFTGDWLVFDWGEYHQSFAMIWMVKDVLSHRPHIPKSKAEKKAIRQMQAKYHIRIQKVK